MKSLEGKLAVVTGAGSGIGRATALELARRGVRLAACDINNAALESLREEITALDSKVVTGRVDVGDRDSVAAFAGRVHGQYGAADILVNSAGVYVTGSALELSLEDWDWVLSANLWGVIHLCHFFLPPMVDAGRGGHVLNLSSMYGFWPSPCVAGYLTSKFGVFGFSEALHEDLRAHRIRVSTVCPGMVNTGLVREMRIKTRGTADAELRGALEHKYARRGYGPERVAKAIIDAIRSGKRLVLVTPESRIMYQIERFAPWLSRRIARRAAAGLFQSDKNGDSNHF